jgi:lysyl-tRNA synthetase class 2
MHFELVKAESVQLAALKLRASLYKTIRDFFAIRNVLEVETPMLSMAGNTDPNIESFQTEFSGPLTAGTRTRWLRTSPEFPLKRLLAAGIGDCYELGRVFRNGEAGRRHNPEFTMLEWYRVGFDHRRLMDEVADLIVLALALVGKKAVPIKRSYAEFFQHELGIDAHHASLQQLKQRLQEFRIDPHGLTRDDWLDLLLTHLIQPRLPSDQLLLLYDYPASQCALAKIRDGDTPVAERFEIYLGTCELANGYHELSDAHEQRGRFESDNTRRTARRDVIVPIDENLLAALASGMPECAGVALGIERLLMYMSDSDDIRDVLAFGFAQA